MATLAVLTIYALGPRWFVGKRLVLEYPVSGELRRLVGTFRATGRFFWPVGHAIAIGSAALVTRRLGRRGVVIVAAAAVVQLVDATAYAKIVRDNTQNAWEHRTDWEFWESLMRRHRRLALYPAWYCWGPLAPEERILNAEREMEFIAARDGLAANHAHMGRVITDCSSGTADLAKLEHDGLEPATLYVFFRAAFGDEVVARLGAERCTPFSDGWACSANQGPERP
jgi:hypothetical protein